MSIVTCGSCGALWENSYTAGHRGHWCRQSDPARAAVLAFLQREDVKEALESLTYCAADDVIAFEYAREESDHYTGAILAALRALAEGQP